MPQQQQIDLTGAGFRDDEAIRVFGHLYAIGVRVCRYDHPGGLNAYLTNQDSTGILSSLYSGRELSVLAVKE